MLGSARERYRIAVMFSIRFGPKLIEVKTLISNFCAALKYHAVKRNRVIWEELSVNEGKTSQPLFSVAYFTAATWPRARSTTWI